MGRATGCRRTDGAWVGEVTRGIVPCPRTVATLPRRQRDVTFTAGPRRANVICRVRLPYPTGSAEKNKIIRSVRRTHAHEHARSCSATRGCARFSYHRARTRCCQQSSRAAPRAHAPPCTVCASTSSCSRPANRPPTACVVGKK